MLPDPVLVEKALKAAPRPKGFAVLMSQEDATRPLLMFPSFGGREWTAVLYAVTKDNLPLWLRSRGHRNGFIERRRVQEFFVATADPVANYQRMLAVAKALEPKVRIAKKQRRRKFVEKPRKRRAPTRRGVKWSEEKSCPSGNPLRLCLHCGRPNHRRRTPCTRDPLAGWTPRA